MDTGKEWYTVKWVGYVATTCELFTDQKFKECAWAVKNFDARLKRDASLFTIVDPQGVLFKKKINWPTRCAHQPHMGVVQNCIYGLLSPALCFT